MVVVVLTGDGSGWLGGDGWTMLGGWWDLCFGGGAFVGFCILF